MRQVQSSGFSRFGDAGEIRASCLVARPASKVSIKPGEAHVPNTFTLVWRRRPPYQSLNYATLAHECLAVPSPKVLFDSGSRFFLVFFCCLA